MSNVIEIRGLFNIAKSTPPFIAVVCS